MQRRLSHLRRRVSPCHQWDKVLAFDLPISRSHSIVLEAVLPKDKCGLGKQRGIRFAKMLVCVQRLIATSRCVLFQFLREHKFAPINTCCFEKPASALITLQYMCHMTSPFTDNLVVHGRHMVKLPLYLFNNTFGRRTSVD